MSKGRGFTLIELMIVLLIISIIAAIAIPNLIEARKHGNEAAAIKGLRTIISAQSLFREKDKEGDQLFDYGTLTELGEQNVIDGVLATGTKQGYTYLTNAGNNANAEYVFYGNANPTMLGGSGDRAFATNHMGVIYYTTQNVAPDVVDANIPAQMVPIN